MRVLFLQKVEYNVNRLKYLYKKNKERALAAFVSWCFLLFLRDKRGCAARCMLAEKGEIGYEAGRSSG